MKNIICILLSFFLVACATQPQMVEIPIAVKAEPTKVKPLGELPLSDIHDNSTPGELISACFKTVYKQQDYISYLWTVGDFKVQS